MVRLPSLVHVIRSAQQSARRFPGTLLSAFIGAGICWLLIRQSQSYKAYEALLSRLLLPAMLGISVFFAVALWLEHSRSADRRHSVGLVPRRADDPSGPLPLLLLRFSTNLYLPVLPASTCFTLLVAVAPFHRGGSVAAFWEFNRILFQRILQSVLFSTIIYAGLAIALWAVQSLLGVKVDWRAYYFLSLSVAFLFNTWFFVAGVPSDWQELESEYEYPAGLRMFVQFILLPLVTLYVVILYGYLVKILIIREWPRGTIGWLVSIVSVFGMLALLLVHPLRNRPGHRWIHLYSRSFYAGVVPADCAAPDGDLAAAVGIWADGRPLLPARADVVDDRHGRLLFISSTTQHQSHSGFSSAARDGHDRWPMGVRIICHCRTN